MVILRCGWILAAAAVITALATGCATIKRYNFFNLPRPEDAQVVYLDQGWSQEERRYFYHVPEGIGFVPYDWFLAFEQPDLSVREAPPFHDGGYLARFGFIPDGVSETNPDGLPIGLGSNEVLDPATGATEELLGFNCATCHTAQITYREKAVRVDGAPAMIDLNKFQAALGTAAVLTRHRPSRFRRFANAVLGLFHTDAQREELREQLGAWISQGTHGSRRTEDGSKLYPTTAGFGRLDALGRGGNSVFGKGIDPANLAVADAPVSYPRIWNVSWFDWVQYTGSIRQPMARNVAQALGVFAKFDLTGPRARRFESSVDIVNLRNIERLLAGDAPGQGLRPPPWPAEVLGPIDLSRAARGAALFAGNCAKCHAPGTRTPPDSRGRTYRQVKLLPLHVIGTDPAAAANFARRKVDTGPLGLGTVSAAEALAYVTERVVARKYDALGLSPEERAEWNGYRKNEWRAPLAYRAPPLEGVWATAPYLHNGSVPTLYQMLLPADQRDKEFYVGGLEFDPVNVGFETAQRDGAFRFRTDVRGNSNQGHEFRDGPRRQGVIGRLLREEERRDLIEYLKTL